MGKSVNRGRTDKTMTKQKVQKDKQRSKIHAHKTKDQVTRTPLVNRRTDKTVTKKSTKGQTMI